MNLIVRGARLPDRPDLVDLGVADGRIQRVATRLAEAGAREIPADGRLVIPGLVESHFHLDKALLGLRVPTRAGTVSGRRPRRSGPSRSKTSPRAPAARSSWRSATGRPRCGPTSRWTRSSACRGWRRSCP